VTAIDRAATVKRKQRTKKSGGHPRLTL